MAVAAIPMVIMAVATVASTAMSVMSAQAQGQQASDAANYNAQVARNNAVAAQQEAQQNALIQQQQARQKIGGVTAGYGASGVDSGSGSALDVLSNSASNAELDRATLIWHGAVQSAGYGNMADLDAARAGNYTANANMSSVGIILGGVTKTASLFSGGGSGSSLLNASQTQFLANPDESAAGT